MESIKYMANRNWRFTIAQHSVVNLHCNPFLSHSRRFSPSLALTLTLSLLIWKNEGDNFHLACRHPEKTPVTRYFLSWTWRRRQWDEKKHKRTFDVLVKCKMYFNKLRAMSHVKASSPRGEVRHYSLLMFTTTLNGDVKQSHLISFRPPHLVICFKQKKKASVSTSCVVTNKL